MDITEENSVDLSNNIYQISKFEEKLNLKLIDDDPIKNNFSIEVLSVSIIIPTINRPCILLNTIKYLVKQNYPKYEILIIDSSNDLNFHLLDFIKEYPFIKYLKTEKKGPSAAKNLGIYSVNSEIVIFCDDDIIPCDDFIVNHIKNYFDNSIGGVSGRVISKNDNQFKKIKDVGKIRFDGSIISNFNADYRIEVDHVYGCNMSFRRNILVDIGGFSLDYSGNAYFEETDLSIRVRKQGYKLVFDPTALVIHLMADEGGVRLHSFREWVYNYIHNYVILLKKHFSSLLFPLFIIRQCFWGIVWTIYHHDLKIPIIIIEAYIHGIKDAKTIRNT